MSDVLPIGILLTADDSLRFLHERPPVDHLLCLSPPARVAAREAGVPMMTASEVYTEVGHCRTLMRRERIERWVAAKGGSGLSATAREVMRQELILYASVSSRLWISIGAGPWLVPTDGGWRKISDRRACHRLLLERVLKGIHHLNPPFGVPSCYWILRFCSRFIARFIGITGGVVIHRPRRGLSGLAKAIRGKGIRVVQFIQAEKDFTSYRKLLSSIRAALRSMPLRLIPVSRITPGLEEMIRQRLQAIEDRVVRDAVALHEEVLARYIATVDGLVDEIEVLLRLAKARSILVWAIYGSMHPSVAEAARRLRIPSMLVAHMSLTQPQGSPTSTRAARSYINFLSGTAMVDTCLAQSPHAAQAALSVDSRVRIIPSQPLVWGGPGPSGSAGEIHESMTQDRVVLYAGNFGIWTEHQPWVMETADEFVDSMIAFVRATATVPRCRLILRLKKKGECDPDIVRKLIGDAAHCTIKDTGSFAEDLSHASLVVSFSSTVIEEALHARRPVFLWGGRQRYFHLPPSFTPPTAHQRGSVYSVLKTVDCPVMIDAILNAHVGSPLTDEELREHCWPAGTGDLDDIAATLVKG